MQHARAGRVRRSSVRDADLDIVHGNSSTCTRHTSSAAGRLYQNVVRRTLLENQLCLSQ
jgi:NADH:ubiquinone oxidoreductase subunit B-like Fe-S oxidoreductase